jgi:hypothetical protein
MTEHSSFSPLHYTVSRRGRWHVITVHDKIRPETDTGELTRLVADLASRGEEPHVAFVFERVSYLFSRVISILVICAKEIKQRHCLGTLAIIADDTHTQLILDRMCIPHDLVKVYPNTAALESA